MNEHAQLLSPSLAVSLGRLTEPHPIPSQRRSHAGFGRDGLSSGRHARLMSAPSVDPGSSGMWSMYEGTCLLYLHLQHGIPYSPASPFVVPGSASLPAHHASKCSTSYHSIPIPCSSLSLHRSSSSRRCHQGDHFWIWRISCCWPLYELNFRQPGPLPVVAVRASSRCPTIDFTNTPLVPTLCSPSCLSAHMLILL